MYKRIFCLLLWGLIIPKSWADVSITTTIRPLQLIAQTILQDHGRVTAIIDASQSPHHYSMSPADRVALADADMLLWIGPTFETYLADFFERPDNASKTLTISELENLTRHEITAGQLDTHLWLDSGNAVLIAELIAQEAGELDAEHADAFRQNLSQFKAGIVELNRELEQSLSASAGNAYAVYHNAYQYFEKQFGLQHQFAMLSDPEIQPGIQQLIAVRERFEEDRPRCLLLEPDSNLELVATALGGHQLTTVTIDLLGHRVDSGQSGNKSGYIQLMKNIAEDLKNCL